MSPAGCGLELGYAVVGEYAGPRGVSATRTALPMVMLVRMLSMAAQATILSLAVKTKMLFLAAKGWMRSMVV